MDNLFVIAWITGFAGSLHCIGMCGPLLLAMPFHHYQGVQKVSSVLLYHAGRVVSYGLLGLAAGFFGDALLLFGIGSWLSLLVGLLLLFVLLLQKKKASIGSAGFQWVVKKIRWSNNNSLANFFVFGLLNGFLPCGMVYAAVAIGIAGGTALMGAGTMICFGLGTLPLLLYVTIGYSNTLIRVRGFIQQKRWTLQLAIACLLILRGLHLGIPFISPESLPHANGVLVSCFK